MRRVPGAGGGVRLYAAGQLPVCGDDTRERAFSAPNANDDQVRRACEVACAWGFVKELPQGIKANIAALPEKKTVLVAAHRAKAREFAAMRLRVVWRGWAW